MYWRKRPIAQAHHHLPNSLKRTICQCLKRTICQYLKRSPSANVSSAHHLQIVSSASPSANTTAEPTSGQSFVWQGTATSQSDPLPGHDKEYVAAILKPRSDNGVYSGVLTYPQAEVQMLKSGTLLALEIQRQFQRALEF